jgi:hypothetical protein
MAPWFNELERMDKDRARGTEKVVQGLNVERSIDSQAVTHI